MSGKPVPTSGCQPATTPTFPEHCRLPSLFFLLFPVYARIVFVALKSLIYQYFRVPSMVLLTCCLAGLALFAGPMRSEPQKPSLPDPIKFINKYDMVWNVAHWVVAENMNLAIELEDKRGGRIVTRPSEFITGSLTSSETQKVAILPETVTGNYIRARYSAEILLEMITSTQTLVTVRTKVEALNRDLDGSEKWVPLQSLGVFEKNILGRISMKLLGSDMKFDTKKGFWEKTPQPVDPRAPKPLPTRPPI